MGPVAGLGHLEPLRHVPDITQPSGAEAATLVEVLARMTDALKIATNSDLVYVTVFGERIAHLHFNLAPPPGRRTTLRRPGMLAPGTRDLPAGQHVDALNAIRATVKRSRYRSPAGRPVELWPTARSPPVASLWHDDCMARIRLSTTVDASLLEHARNVRSGTTDAALVDEALAALLARYRSAEVDASYAAYDEHPLDEPDDWGDLASFRRAASAS